MSVDEDNCTAIRYGIAIRLGAITVTRTVELRSSAAQHKKELAEANRLTSAEKMRADKAVALLRTMTESHRVQWERTNQLSRRIKELENESERRRTKLFDMQQALQDKDNIIADYEDEFGARMSRLTAELLRGGVATD
ncbi:hypothetical protein GGI20_004322 [Coemansia sp. BCRC 34301]|nr:hypothetical protein GGI20_004322 [Coemansia sp. BCRC 34301]